MVQSFVYELIKNKNKHDNFLSLSLVCNCLSFQYCRKGVIGSAFLTQLMIQLMMKHSNYLLQTNNHYLLFANEKEENAFLEPVVLKIRNRLIKVKEE